MAQHFSVFVLLLFIVANSATEVTSQNTKKFTVVNNCNDSVWPAIFGNGNASGTIGELKRGQSAVLNVPSNWSGRVWGRTGCNFDTTGTGSCQTGGCGSSRECTSSGSPPASIGQFTLGDLDYYEVSLVEGFNLPMVITALKGKGNCSKAGCDADLRQSCPSQLAFKPNGTVIACGSACDVFKTEAYCCRTGEGCQPSNYSMTFKSACPAAASYALDESTSLITCVASEYVVSFCTPRNGTVCSYHDGNVSCNGSSGLTMVSPGWWALITLLPFLFTTHL